jgi:hypothetical protein
MPSSVRRFPSGERRQQQLPKLTLDFDECEGFRDEIASRCVYVRNGEIIGTGSNRTNEERNVSLRFI